MGTRFGNEAIWGFLNLSVRERGADQIMDWVVLVGTENGGDSNWAKYLCSYHPSQPDDT
jgi:hypothetical protein